MKKPETPNSVDFMILSMSSNLLDLLKKLIMEAKNQGLSGLVLRDLKPKLNNSKKNNSTHMSRRNNLIQKSQKMSKKKGKSSKQLKK